MRKIWTNLVSIFAPIPSMARSLDRISENLSIIRELYEEELAQRSRPVWRVTERPGTSDTEILYSSEPPPRRDPFSPEEDEDENAFIE